MAISREAILLFDTKQNRWSGLQLSRDVKEGLGQLREGPPNICYNPIAKQLHLLSIIQPNNGYEMVIINMNEKHSLNINVVNIVQLLILFVLMVFVISLEDINHIIIQNQILIKFGMMMQKN